MKTPRSVRALASVLALSSVLVPATVGAYQVTGSRWNVRSLPIRYSVNAASAPSSLGAAAALNAVQSAFATWQAPACTSWRSQYAGATSVALASTDDGENSVLWLASGWNADPRNNPMGDVRGTIGVTQTSRIVGGATSESDISFNAQGFRWSTTGTGGTVDAQSIAVHEEGHFLGLDHTPIEGAIMYASYSSGLKRTLHSDDISGVCALYPSGVTGTDAGVADTGARDTGTSGTPGALGANCSGSATCASGNVCVCRDATETDCFCSRRCSSTSPCPSEFACASTTSGGLCVPDPSGGPTTMTGTGTTGTPCESGDACASGICVQTRVGNAFCTQVCTNDCSCPTAYRCAMTTSGTNVCAPGPNTCASSPPDSGVRDTGTVDPPGEDAEAPPEDAGVPPMMEGGRADGGTTGMSPGCACAVPGAGMTRGAARSVWAAPWALLALAGGLRLRARRRGGR